MAEHAIPPKTADGKSMVTKEQNGVVEAVERPASAIQAEEWSVEKALADLEIKNPSRSPDSPISFFHMLSRLKTTKRAGWQRFGIEHGESISDHMYRMSIITMLAPPSLRAKGLNVAKCTQMAVVHDMAEALVGDITPHDKVAKQEKSRREETTMMHLTEKLLGSQKNGMNIAGQEIMDLWLEYEGSKTLESKFVHDVDKLELMLQMMEYEKGHKQQKDLGEFCYVGNRIELPEVREWCLEILQERKKFWGEKFATTEGADQVRKFMEMQEVRP